MADEYSAAFPDIFQNFFTSAGRVDPKDRDKAKALLEVICKSSANLGEMVKLADALDLTLGFEVRSKLKTDEKEGETK